jgi:entericidin B
VFMRKMVLLGACSALMMLAACNTVSGAGRDVSSAGHAVTKSAEPVN